MSITSARNFIEKSGCGWITGAALVLVMIGGMFGIGQCDRNMTTEDQRPIVQVAKIGGQVVDYNAIRDLADRNIQQSMMAEEGIDPAVEGRLYGNVTQSVVTRAIIQQVAAERNLSVDDTELKKNFEAAMEGEVMRAKFQMIQNKLIKPDASEAEFAAAFKNANGKDLAEAKAEAMTQFEETIKDPKKRAEAALDVLAQKVQDSYKSSITLSDADLKKSFDTYTTKRIIAYATGGASEAENEKIVADARAKIDRVAKELKAGANFEALMNRETDDPVPAKGKPKSESTLDLKLSDLTYDASLEPILKLKVGEVSPILPTSSGPAVYKLYKIQNKLPANFEKEKATLKEQRIKDMAVRAYSDDLRKRASSIKFDSPVAKHLVDWRIAITDPGLNIDRPKLKERLKEILDGMRASNDSVFDPRAITLATYAVFKDYYKELTPAERQEVVADRMELLKAALEASPQIDAFHELTKIAMAAKDGTTAFEALKSAMDTNAGSTDLAVSRFKAQSLLRSQLAATGLLKPEQAKELAASLDRWKSDLAEDLKLAAQSNADYSESGEADYKALLAKLDRFVGAGYISSSTAAGIRAEAVKWKAGVFDDLKIQIEANTDYSDFGQTTYDDLGARIDKYAKASYIDASQKSQLLALQAKWLVEKKKADAEAKKNAPKPGPAPSTSGSAGPPKPSTGGASSNDLLKGTTTGN